MRISTRNTICSFSALFTCALSLNCSGKDTAAPQRLPVALAFTVQPSTAPMGAIITPPVRVAALDASGNPATSFEGYISIDLAPNDSGASLSGTTSVAAVKGVAMFSDLRVTRSGAGLTLVAVARGLPRTSSASFEAGPCKKPCWTFKSSMPDAPTEFASGVINGVVYVVGGREANRPVATVQAYDVVSDSWSFRAPMPTARINPSVGVVNGILYAVGGTDFVTNLGTVEAYNPATDRWTTKAPMPTPRPGACVGVVNGIIYVAGGAERYGAVGTVEAYDPATNQWTEKASMRSRTNCAAGVVDNTLYVLGGDNGDWLDGVIVSDAVEAYDPATDAWTARPAMPTARTGLSVAAINGVLYAIGGRESDGTVVSGAALPVVESFDPRKNGWGGEPSMLRARAFLGAGAVNGALLAVGGMDGPTQALSSVEAYVPP